MITILEPRQTILVIQGPILTDAYVRFWGDEPTGWRRDGAYVALVQYYPRRHEVFRIGNKPFLRISNQGVAGTGVSEEIESWFDLTQPGLRPVFGFAPQGKQDRFGVGIGREIHASAIPSLNDGSETISVRLAITFSGMDLTLGQARYLETYERRPGETVFTRRAQSGQPALTDRELELLLDLDRGPTNEQLLLYTLPELEQVARGRNADARDSLRKMLDEFEDTREKRSLLALLGRP